MEVAALRRILVELEASATWKLVQMGNLSLCNLSLYNLDYSLFVSEQID